MTGHRLHSIALPGAVLALVTSWMLIAGAQHPRHAEVPRVLHPSGHAQTRQPQIGEHPISRPATVPALHP